MGKTRFSNARGGAAITVKVIPRARHTGLDGLMDDGTLKIRVAAPPVGGAANKALIAYLAEALDLPRSQIEIVAGETSERKLISLAGIAPEAVEAAVRRLLGGAESGSGQPSKRM